MGSAYGYQHSFNDPLANKFREILSLNTPSGPSRCQVASPSNTSIFDGSLKTTDRKQVEACLTKKQGAEYDGQ